MNYLKNVYCCLDMRCLRGLFAVALFAFVGVVIKPEREVWIMGIRREDMFHYMIGVDSYGMALGLK